MWGSLTFPVAATASLWLGMEGGWRTAGGVLLVAASALILWIARRVLRDWATGALALKTNAAVA
jgi:tellurite resistance protein